jgi:rubredoxin
VDGEPSETIARFEQGLAAGLDPDNARRAGPDAGCTPDRVVTGLRSRWLHRRCQVCGHTFRPGDEVRVEADGRVLHDLPGLRCAQGDAAPASASESVSLDAFFQGLEAAWPLSDDIRITRLVGDHALLAPPRAGFARHACRVCGHTFRPLENVVICPCSPNAPRCLAAVHRDLVHQLHCWDEWIKSEGSARCLLAT